MKILTHAILPASVLMAAGVPLVSAAASDDTAVPPSSAFSPIQRYAITYDKPRDLAEFYVRDFGFRPRDADIVEVKHPSDRSMRILVATIDGLEDDSVQGFQIRLDIKTTQGSWETVEAGVRRKCQRGPNADQWTRDVCP